MSSISQQPELTVYCHQDVIPLPGELLQRLELAGRRALPKVLEVAACPDSALATLDEVEVSFIDDATIADVHLRFMEIAGATDVITFDHGEIHISVETAQRHAAEFGNDFESELMLYMVHGLLHLAGHEDASDAGRAAMDMFQLSILKEVW